MPVSHRVLLFASDLQMFAWRSPVPCQQIATTQCDGDFSVISCEVNLLDQSSSGRVIRGDVGSVGLSVTHRAARPTTR